MRNKNSLIKRLLREREIKDKKGKIIGYIHFTEKGEIKISDPLKWPGTIVDPEKQNMKKERKKYKKNKSRLAKLERRAKRIENE